MVLPVRLLNKRFVRDNGKSATITTYAISGQDTYGRDTYTETTHDVTAVLSFSRRVLVLEEESQGIQYVIEAEIYIEDEDFDDMGIEFPLSPDKKRPKITFDNVDYSIFETEQPGIGLTRLIARKKRS